jgi:RecA-family ATPase
MPRLRPPSGDLTPGDHGTHTVTRHPTITLVSSNAIAAPKVESNNLDSHPPITARIQWVDTARWDSEECPRRKWAIHERVPLRQVALFSGEGSIGKSIVELMCSVAHVTGKDWLDSLPEPGGAFYIGCEDDEEELRIRLTPIIKHYGTTYAQLKPTDSALSRWRTMIRSSPRQITTASLNQPNGLSCFTKKLAT